MMALCVDIPGYDYDPIRKRYFKRGSSPACPPGTTAKANLTAMHQQQGNERVAEGSMLASFPFTMALLLREISCSISFPFP